MGFNVVSISNALFLDKRYDFFIGLLPVTSRRLHNSCNIYIYFAGSFSSHSLAKKKWITANNLIECIQFDWMHICVCVASRMQRRASGASGMCVASRASRHVFYSPLEAHLCGATISSIQPELPNALCMCTRYGKL